MRLGGWREGGISDKTTQVIMNNALAWYTYKSNHKTMYTKHMI